MNIVHPTGIRLARLSRGVCPDCQSLLTEMRMQKMTKCSNRNCIFLAALDYRQLSKTEKSMRRRINPDVGEDLLPVKVDYDFQTS